MDLAREKQRLLQHLRREIRDEKVLEAMAKVPREAFVPEHSRHLAYEDIPLPIGHGQTISQPFIVALMTEALGLRGHEKVLEIGAGSGYQAAILAELAREVFSVERYLPLAARAREVLDRLGYINIHVCEAEQTLGRRQDAPYDAIIVTAGAPRIPQELLSQLVVGGRLVIPVGSLWEQDLLKVTKEEQGIKVQNLGPCRFVPLVGIGAWSEVEDRYWGPSAPDF